MTAGRKLLFRIHAWIGLNLGLLLFVICFSGTVAVFSHELDWLADPASRAEPPPGGGRQTIGWQAMHDVVAKAHPHALILYLHAPDGVHSAARAGIAYGPGDFRTVLIDPHSGEIRGLRSGFNLVSFFRIFHKQLYIVPTILWTHGTLITGALAIPLLIGAVTGLLSLRRWRRALVTLRQGRSPRLFWSDLHRLVGLWALLVTIVLSLTGLWYFAEKALHMTGQLTEEARPTRIGSGELRQRAYSLTPLDLDRAASLAQHAFPALVIEHVELPSRPGDPLTFAGRGEAWLVRDRANNVQIDPYSGDVRQIHRAEHLGAFDRLVETADLLHFGTFGGLTSRVLWFVAGLMLSGGILCGLYSAWLRLRHRAPAVPRSRRAALATLLPTVALLAASVYGTWAYGGEALRSAVRPLRAVPLAEGAIGPWHIAITRIASAPSAYSTQTQVRFLGDAHPNFRSAALWIGEAEPPAALPPAWRQVDRLWSQVALPTAECGDRCALNFAIEGWDGTRHTLRVDPRPRADGSATYSLPIAEKPPVGTGVVIGAFALCLAVPLIGWARLLWR